MVRGVGADRERQAMAIHDRHDFHAFSTLGRSDLGASALRHHKGCVDGNQLASDGGLSGSLLCSSRGVKQGIGAPNIIPVHRSGYRPRTSTDHPSQHALTTASGAATANALAMQTQLVTNAVRKARPRCRGSRPATRGQYRRLTPPGAETQNKRNYYGTSKDSSPTDSAVRVRYAQPASPSLADLSRSCHIFAVGFAQEPKRPRIANTKRRSKAEPCGRVFSRSKSKNQIN